MKTSWKVVLAILFGVSLIVCLSVLPNLSSPAYGGGQGAGGASPRYSVLDSEGHNLIVTDNKTNVLYFYTTDKDQPVGSELRLRGSIDLSQVGSPTIKPAAPK